MTHRIGQFLRGVGLLIELLGVIAVVAQTRKTEIPQISLPGQVQVGLGWVAVAVGFVVWLIGGLLILGSHRASRSHK
jgi:hypothetical protein